MSSKKILMIGPDAGKNSGGGIATYIASIITVLKNSYSIKRIVTLKEPSLIRKLCDFITSLMQVVYYTISKKNMVAHVHVASKSSFKRKSFLIRYLYFRKIPIILHLHGGGFHIFYGDSSPKKQKHIENIFLMSSEIVVLSKSWEEWLSKHIKHHSINIIYNGSKDYLKNDNIVSERDNLIIFIGKISKDKGVYDLLKAFKKLNKKHSDTKLIIAGNGEVSIAKKMTEELNIENCVEFIGWIGEEEKTKLLNRAKIFILPSYKEGLPIGILEAMSAKLAIISTPVGGIPETIQNDKNGILVPVGDIKEIERAMDTIISDDKYCDYLSQNARASYLSSFSLDIVCNRLIQLYQKEMS